MQDGILRPEKDTEFIDITMNSDARPALEDLVRSIKSIFEKYTQHARGKAWKALTSPKGKALINTLVPNPKRPTPGLRRLLSFREWMEQAVSFDELWQERMQPTTQYNLLTNYEATLRAIGLLEVGNAARTDWLGESAGDVFKHLQTRMEELRKSWSDPSWHTDPEDEAYLLKQINPSQSIGTIYGSGGYHRYFVRLNGDVEFSKGHAMQEYIQKAQQADFKIF